MRSRVKKFPKFPESAKKRDSTAGPGFTTLKNLRIMDTIVQDVLCIYTVQCTVVYSAHTITNINDTGWTI